MPRLAPSLLHHARRKHPLLPILLRECIDTRSAQNELRWLKEHAFALQSSLLARAETLRQSDAASAPGWRTILSNLVTRRARGEPLQYILGTQPFGDLEILCHKGVLIPRPETEAYTAKLAELVGDLRRAELAATTQKLRILDLCTGTGCISLLLHSLLRPPSAREVGAHDGSNALWLNADLDILGIDISNTALRLATDNLHHNVEKGTLHSSAEQQVSYMRADVLNGPTGNGMVPQDSAPDSECETFDADLGEMLQRESLGKKWDILIANPPYISPRQFLPGGTTTRSVRRWEPQLALVPRPLRCSSLSKVKRSEHKNQLERGDEFYPPLLELARSVDTKAVVLEVGGNEQALRIRKMAGQCFAGESDVAIEIWTDDGTVDTGVSDGDGNDLGSECRAVVVWRSSWAKWRTSSLGTRRQRI